MEREYSSNREYTPRRTSNPAARQAVTRTSSGSRYRSAPPPRRGGRNRRGGGPPPILFLGIAAVVIVVLVIVLVNVFGGKKDDGQGASSGAPSSQASGVTSTPGSAAEPTTAPEPTATPAPTRPPEQNQNVPAEQIGNLLKLEDSAFEYYNFVEEYAKEYTTIISKAATQLGSAATVYDMIIPTGIDILLPADTLSGVNTSDQTKAIDFMYQSIQAQNSAVKTVSLMDPLKMHRDQYIYFRTDHHWTQLGAYYAYEEFCKVRGFTPVALDQFDKKSYEGFTGSFYAENNSLKPDTVDAYIPKANVTMTTTQSDGTVLEDYPLIADGTDFDPSYLYLIFIGGDQMQAEIVNNDMAEGPTCVVVKESFGNAFVPFLVNHYKTIYVLDYRYFSGNIADFAKEKGATDLIFANNISMTRSEDLVGSLSNNF